MDVVDAVAVAAETASALGVLGGHVAVRAVVGGPRAGVVTPRPCPAPPPRVVAVASVGGPVPRQVEVVEAPTGTVGLAAVVLPDAGRAAGHVGPASPPVPVAGGAVGLARGAVVTPVTVDGHADVLRTARPLLAGRPFATGAAVAFGAVLVTVAVTNAVRPTSGNAVTLGPSVP